MPRFNEYKELEMFVRRLEAFSYKYMSAKMVAAKIGLTAANLYKMAQRDQIPSHKINGQRRFVLSEVKEAIQFRRFYSGVDGECDGY